MLALVCLAVAGWLLPGALLPGALLPAHAAARVDRWVAPLAGPLAVRRGFDPPPVRWGAGHRGVDLAAYPGALVRAAGAGHVGYAGVLAGRGVLVVRHGTLRTTYEPVRPLVRAGTVVAAGTPVALLSAGHAGPARAGEALLHWGLLDGDAYLDPLSVLRRGPSRLLPVAPAAPPPDVPAAVLAAAAQPAAGLPSPGARAPSREPPPDHEPPRGRSGKPGRSGRRAPAPATAAAVAGLAGAAVVSRRSRASPRPPPVRPSRAYRALV